jgi:hypothetical protein
MATSASSPCVKIRKRGRPIVTGNDLVHPSPKLMAAATGTMRAAVTPAAYSDPKTTSTNQGIARKNTGTATSITLPAHFE